MKRCPECKGSGNLGHYDAYEYANGKVMTFTHECPKCRGTGQVKK